MKNPPEFKGKNAEIIEAYIRYAKLNGKKEKSILGEQWRLKAFVQFMENQIADGHPTLKGRVCKGRPPLFRK